MDTLSRDPTCEQITIQWQRAVCPELTPGNLRRVGARHKDKRTGRFFVFDKVYRLDFM